MKTDSLESPQEHTPLMKPPPEQVTGDQGYLKEFIFNLEVLPELWDSSSSNYKNTIKRGEALKYLLDIYRKIKADATVDDVKKKINILRSNYRKESKKIESSKRSRAGADEIYNPKSWVFHMLQFLDKTEKPVTRGATKVIIEPQEDQEHDQNDRHQRPVEHNLGAFSSVNEIIPPPQKQRKKGPIQKQNKLLEKACSFLAQPPVIPSATSPINATALYWSQKLERLNRTQKLFAEKYINEILLGAELGNLGRNSLHMNCHDQIVTPSSTPPPTYPVQTTTPSPAYPVRTPTSLPGYSFQSAAPSSSKPFVSTPYQSPNLPSCTVVSGTASQIVISKPDDYVTLHRSFSQEDVNEIDSYTVGSLFASFRPANNDQV